MGARASSPMEIFTCGENGDFSRVADCNTNRPDGENEANAKLICLAVKYHYSLVSAVKTLMLNHGVSKFEKLMFEKLIESIKNQKYE